MEGLLTCAEYAGAVEGLVFKWEGLLTFAEYAGAVEGLVFKWEGKTGARWASPDNNLARFMYSSYVEDDFTDFLNTYLYMEVTEDNSWCALILAKAPAAVDCAVTLVVTAFDGSCTTRALTGWTACRHAFTLANPS